MTSHSHEPSLDEGRRHEMMENATSLSYFETTRGPLHAHFFLPKDFSSGQARTAIVFLHGGFWDTGMPSQFVPQALHLASRGAVTLTAETRVKANHETGPIEALSDVQTLLEWLQKHASNFGIDPRRIVLAGAAGGAMLALECSFATRTEEEIAPAAVIGLSALVDPESTPAVLRFADRAEARAHAPLRQIRRDLPPLLLLHGREDRVTPYGAVEKFARKLKRKRNFVELIDLAGAGHAFFNWNVSPRMHDLSLREMDRFLTAQDLLAPAPQNEF